MMKSVTIYTSNFPLPFAVHSYPPRGTVGNANLIRQFVALFAGTSKPTLYIIEIINPGAMPNRSSYLPNMVISLLSVSEPL